MTIAQIFVNFVRRLRRRRRIEGVRRIGSRADLPTDLGGWMYVVGAERPKWAVLQCPCRCGEQIDVNLMTSRRPYWRVTVSGTRASLTPSLWMPNSKCGSHFFLHENQIQWVRSQHAGRTRSQA